MQKEEILYFNGINGDNGEYDLPPMGSDQLASLIQGEAPSESLSDLRYQEPDNLSELRFRYQQQAIKQLGVQEAIDPRQLSQAGWGIIFTHDEDPEIKEALGDLIALRKNQAGAYFRLYDGSEGLRPDESKSEFLTRHGAGPGPANPEKVPYYLLLIGGPKKIPYRFQSQLDIQYAVGRIHFDTLDEYANYAQSVVAAETGRVRLPRQATFFTPENEGDQTTQLISKALVQPLYEVFRQEKDIDWSVTSHLADEATKARLTRLLGGDQTPALLFSASHGLTFPVGSERQVSHQGSIVTQDWPGPRGWSNKIPQDFYFAGDDLTTDVNLLGLIAFFYASYAGGTPHLDEFAAQAFNEETTIAPEALLSRLPHAMLGHPRGGALAVIGQVDRAWGFSFPWAGLGGYTNVFESAIRRLLNGYPVGSAMEYFNERYAELSTILSDELEEIAFGKMVDPGRLSGTWTANKDARGFTIIGDPAVRMAVSEAPSQSIAPFAGATKKAGSMMGSTILGRRQAINVFVPSVTEPVDQRDGPSSGTVRPDIQDLQPDSRPVPEFVVKIRSHDEEVRQQGIEEALQITQRAATVFEQAADKAKKEGNPELEFSEEDRKVLENQKALNKEIRRQVSIVERYQDTGRQDALLILENLGPVTKTDALPVLKKLASSDPDIEFRASVVPAIVAIENDRPALLGELRKLLRDGQPAVRETVMESFLELDPPALEALNDLWDLSTDEDLGQMALETIFSIEDDKSKLLSFVFLRMQGGELENASSRATLGWLYLEEATTINETWRISKENKILILGLIMATLAEGDDYGRQSAAEWLTSRADEIPGESLDKIVADLKQLYFSGDDVDLQNDIIALSEKLSARKKVERILLLRDLRSDDSAVQIDAIKRAAETDDEWALRILIEEWVQWIASGQSEKTQLVEEVAEKMRHNSLAVLPLVNHLTQEFQPSEELLKAASSASAVLVPNTGSQRTSNVNPNNLEALQNQIDQLLKEELDTRDWNIQQRILKQLNDSKNADLDEEAKRKQIRALIEIEFKERELRVHQRIARQLADMSNPNYFDDDEEKKGYQKIRGSLEKYGVPVLARLLPAAADDDIRKNLAYSLGNVGGRESVDALARAVVGEERTRANRQKLLAEYYLDPSKQRSDEAAEILKGAVAEAKQTLRIQQYLNIIVFFVGLIVLVGGLSIAVSNDDNATRVAGILAAIGGFGGVIFHLIKNPMDRIQNAMANLVQLETAFTSFIWELNLNGTYIQSQYVAEGILTDDDIAQTVDRIEDAMNLTMDQVAIYTDRGRQILTPYITNLSPVVGKPGNAISVFGQHLKKDNGNQKKGQQIAIAINHIPVPAKDQSKDRDIVKFELPADLPPNLIAHSDTLWVSLIINGVETNALSFNLVRQSDDG